jgi:DNA-directed RNA polymerase subunit beta
MPWQGYNFEDAIVISRRCSARRHLHRSTLSEFELEVRETKRGEEELTGNSNVSEEAAQPRPFKRNRLGAEEGDISDR